MNTKVTSLLQGCVLIVGRVVAEVSISGTAARTKVPHRGVEIAILIPVTPGRRGFVDRQLNREVDSYDGRRAKNHFEDCSENR